MAYHDALMEKDRGITKAEREMSSSRPAAPTAARIASSRMAPFCDSGEEPAYQRSGRDQLPQGRHRAAAEGHARLRLQDRAQVSRGRRRRCCRTPKPWVRDEVTWDIGASPRLCACQPHAPASISTRAVLGVLPWGGCRSPTPSFPRMVRSAPDDLVSAAGSTSVNRAPSARYRRRGGIPDWRYRTVGLAFRRRGRNEGEITTGGV